MRNLRGRRELLGAGIGLFASLGASSAARAIIRDGVAGAGDRRARPSRGD